MNALGSVVLAIKDVSYPIIVGILWIIAATSLSKCVPPNSPESSEAAYTAQLLGCVEKSSTVDDSRACRAKVNERWGLCVEPRKVELCP